MGSETSDEAGKLTFLETRLLRAARKLDERNQSDLAAIAEAWLELQEQEQKPRPALRLVAGHAR